MEGFIHFITGFGVLAIMLVIFAETGLLIGFVFPGDSLLFTAGYLVQQNILPINIHVFVLLLFIAGVLGESTGYMWGRYFGKKLYNRPDGKIFKKAYLQKAEDFYKKHGPLAIVLAVFVPVVRTFVPLVAGVGKMDYRKFIPFNILGVGIWTAGFTYLGYFAGAQLNKMGINIEAAALIIIFLSISPMIIHALKDKKRRQAIWHSVQYQARTIFSRKK
jgi:membrane-associated protein